MPARKGKKSRSDLEMESVSDSSVDSEIQESVDKVIKKLFLLWKSELATVLDEKLDKKLPKVQELIQKIVQLEKRVADLEAELTGRQSAAGIDRSRYIVIFGIPENSLENSAVIQTHIKDLGAQLGLSIDYDDCYRMGKP